MTTQEVKTISVIVIQVNYTLDILFIKELLIILFAMHERLNP